VLCLGKEKGRGSHPRGRYRRGTSPNPTDERTGTEASERDSPVGAKKKKSSGANQKKRKGEGKEERIVSKGEGTKTRSDAEGGSSIWLGPLRPATFKETASHVRTMTIEKTYSTDDRRTEQESKR